jgi:phage shock protein PspC (stress-responsive transcriptional regulator)
MPPGGPGVASFFDRIRAFGAVRPDEGRWAAGVASGLARRWGLDPILVRGAFVLAALFGGVGLLLYGLGWLFLPHPDGRIHAQEVLRGTVTAGFVGGVLCVLADLGGSGWRHNSWYGPHPFGGGLVMVGLIVFAIWWFAGGRHRRGPHGRGGWHGSGGWQGPGGWHGGWNGPAGPGGPGGPGAPTPGAPGGTWTAATPPPSAPAGAPAPGEPAPPAGSSDPSGDPSGRADSGDPSSDPSGHPGQAESGDPSGHPSDSADSGGPSGNPLDVAPSAPADSSPAGPGSGEPASSAWGPGPAPAASAALPAYGTPPAPTATLVAPPPPVIVRTPPRPDLSRPSHALTRVVLGAALLSAGAVLVLDRLVGAAPAGSVAAAVALGVVAVGVLVAGVLGRRAGGLAPIGILLAIVTLGAAADTGTVTWAGDRVWAPGSVTGRTQYSLGIGDARLDLANVSAPGATAANPAEIDARVGVGALTVLVPQNVKVRVIADAGNGEVVNSASLSPTPAAAPIPAGTSDPHKRADLDVSSGSDPVLLVRADVGAGRLSIVQTASPER